MSFFIEFDKPSRPRRSFASYTKENVAHGRILLGENTETFETDLNTYSVKQYQTLWASAIDGAVNRRRTTALISNVSIGNDGIGMVWLYPLVPAEAAAPVKSIADAIPSYPSDPFRGVYITERHMMVTTEAERLTRPFYLTLEDDDGGETRDEYETPLYYFDVNAPERLFAHLDDSILGISNWYVSNDALLRARDRIVPDV